MAWRPAAARSAEVLTVGAAAVAEVVAVIVCAAGEETCTGATHWLSYQQVDADEELARTGVRITGTIAYFNDARKASNRDITVEYLAADGVPRYGNAPVDHEQHPSVGEQVTVAYREQDSDQAVVLGYESNSEFLGGVIILWRGRLAGHGDTSPQSQRPG